MVVSANVTVCSVTLLQDTAHRRPYEVLMLLRPSHVVPVLPVTGSDNYSAAIFDQQQSHASSMGPVQAASKSQTIPPDGLVMVAVPGEHSRKPKLGQLLERYLPVSPRSLEVGLSDAVWGSTKSRLR